MKIIMQPSAGLLFNLSMLVIFGVATYGAAFSVLIRWWELPSEAVQRDALYLLSWLATLLLAWYSWRCHRVAVQALQRCHAVETILREAPGEVEQRRALGAPELQPIQATLPVEIDLRQQTKFLATIIESSDDAIFGKTLDGIILSWNKGAEKLYGYTAAEVKGHHVALLAPPECQDELADIFKRLKTGEAIRHLETVRVRKDGTRISVGLTISPICNSVGQITAASIIARDITAQKKLQAEQQLYTQRIEEMQHFLESSLAAFPGSTAVLASDGTILKINAAWQQLGEENGSQSPLHYLGENYLTVCDTAAGLDAPEAASAASGIRAVIEGCQPAFYLEYPCYSPTTERWFGLRITPFAEAPPRRVVVAHLDITERIRAEKAEREQWRLAEAQRDSIAALTASLDEQQVMQQILDSVLTVVPGDASSIILFEGNEGRVAYLQGFTPEASATLRDYRFPLTALACRELFTHEQGYWVPDTQVVQDRLAIPLTDWIRSSIGIPIKRHEQIIGVLSVDSAIAHHFQSTDINKLQAFARYASLAIENAYQVAELEQRVTERTAELQAAKEHVEAILNYSLDGMLLVDADLHIQQTNRAFNTLLACAPDDHCVGSLRELIHLADLPHVNEVIQTVLQKCNGQQVEMHCYRKNGALFDAELSIGYIQANSLVLTLRDITERKRAENALAEEHNLLRTLIDAIPDAIYVKDTQHRFVLTNVACAGSFGLNTEGAIGKDDLAFFPPEMAAQFKAVEAQLFRSGLPLINHEEYSLKNGRPVWSSTTKVPLRNLAGELIGLVGINRDITERKQAAEALCVQRDFLQLVIDSVPDLITVNHRTGHFQLVNVHAAGIYGLTPAEMVGKTDVEANPNPDQASFFLETDRAALDSGQMLFIPEQRILDRYYQTTKIPLSTPTGPPERLLVVSVDITKRKEAETALQQALAQEKEVGELKSRFLSMASHEFRTPLTCILLQAETLCTYRHKLSEDQIEQRLGKIRTQVEKLQDIMEDVLQLLRLQARRAVFNPVPLDLAALYQSILEELQSQAGGAGRLLYTCDANLREVQVDKKLMQQLITNLVINALKYSPTDKSIQVSLHRAENAFVFQVRDEGIGIPAADLDHVFEPFHRATNVDSIAGTGLGLAIVKEAVELHGGTITVFSEVGVGTTFTVHIPVPRSGEQTLDENSRH